MLAEQTQTWGSTPQERELEFPCDRYLIDTELVLYRAVSVDAPAPVLFRWLCQLRAAPYSYDWVDNLGRRSPQRLTPGLDELEVGETVMTIFELVEFERDRHLTAVLRRARRAFGDAAVTYLIVPRPEGGCRLVVKLLWDPLGPRPVKAVERLLFPLGDLVMMRRQLLNLKRLAEGGL